MPQSDFVFIFVANSTNLCVRSRIDRGRSVRSRIDTIHRCRFHGGTRFHGQPEEQNLLEEQNHAG